MCQVGEGRLLCQAEAGHLPRQRQGMLLVSVVAARRRLTRLLPLTRGRIFSSQGNVFLCLMFRRRIISLFCAVDKSMYYSLTMILRGGKTGGARVIFTRMIN